MKTRQNLFMMIMETVSWCSLYQASTCQVEDNLEADVAVAAN